MEHRETGLEREAELRQRLADTLSRMSLAELSAALALIERVRGTGSDLRAARGFREWSPVFRRAELLEQQLEAKRIQAELKALREREREEAAARAPRATRAQAREALWEEYKRRQQSGKAVDTALGEARVLHTWYRQSFSYLRPISVSRLRAAISERRMRSRRVARKK